MTRKSHFSYGNWCTAGNQHLLHFSRGNIKKGTHSLYRPVFVTRRQVLVIVTAVEPGDGYFCVWSGPCVLGL